MVPAPDCSVLLTMLEDKAHYLFQRFLSAFGALFVPTTTYTKAWFPCGGNERDSERHEGWRQSPERSDWDTSILSVTRVYGWLSPQQPHTQANVFAL